MKATSGRLPVGDGWTYEVKWDGMRALVAAGPGVPFSITSANGREVANSYPDLEPGASSVPVPAIVDGEIVALDGDGNPSFGLLQQRMHVASRTDAMRRAERVPISYVVFDLVHLDGRDITALPWHERRRLLEDLFDDWDGDARWQLVPTFDDGPALLAACEARGLEGVMAKRVDSRYEPGRRSRSWVKVKVRRQQEFVIGGWLPGEGNRSGRMGALLVGYYDQPGAGELRFAGRVGTGFSDAELARLGETFATLRRDECPFVPPPSRAEAPHATWIEPSLVCEVAFTEWTGEGRLRHPAYLGLRNDKDPPDVVREP